MSRREAQPNPRTVCRCGHPRYEHVAPFGYCFACHESHERAFCQQCHATMRRHEFISADEPEAAGGDEAKGYRITKWGTTPAPPATRFISADGTIRVPPVMTESDVWALVAEIAESKLAEVPAAGPARLGLCPTWVVQPAKSPAEEKPAAPAGIADRRSLAANPEDP